MLDLFSKIFPPPVSQVSNVTVYSILIRAIQRIPLARAPRRARNVDRTQRGRVWIHSNCLTSPYNARTLYPSVRDTRISHLAIYGMAGRRSIPYRTNNFDTTCQLQKSNTILRLAYAHLLFIGGKKSLLTILLTQLHSSRRVMIWILSYVKICITYSYTLQLS